VKICVLRLVTAFQVRFTQPLVPLAKHMLLVMPRCHVVHNMTLFATGPHYVGGTNDANIQMATSNDASEVSYTRTTIYPPKGPVKQSQTTKTRTLSPKPLKKTTVTTIPPPSRNQITKAPPLHHSDSNALEPRFRRAPTCMASCPSCHQVMVRTQTRTQPSVGTWIAVITLVILFWPICWIPFVCDTFKKTEHYCSHCGVKVGEVKPFQDCFDKRRG
jgi:hypothetical protein